MARRRRYIVAFAVSDGHITRPLARQRRRTRASAERALWRLSRGGLYGRVVGETAGARLAKWRGPKLAPGDSASEEIVMRLEEELWRACSTSG